jgi:hypothetical protein
MVEMVEIICTVKQALLVQMVEMVENALEPSMTGSHG